MTTANKAMTQPAHGSDTNTWDVPVNANTGIIDTAFGGVTAISVTAVSGTVTLTSTQYTPPNFVFYGTLTANVNYQLPSGVGGFWSVYNDTSGAFTLTISSAAGGSTVVTTQGKRTMVIADGTNRGVMQTDNTQAAAGSNTYIQYNNNGVLGATSTLAWNGTSLLVPTMTSTNDITANSITFGSGGGSVTTNVASGISALSANTTGANNTANGYHSLSANTTASSNTAVGHSSGASLTTGGDNTAIGESSLLVATTASSNTAIGCQALPACTTGIGNSAVGYQALYSVTTGLTNVAHGYLAGNRIVSGTANITIGPQSPGATAGSGNICIGQSVFSLGNATTAANNISIGTLSMGSLTTGDYNVALGWGAMASVSTGSGNWAIGASSGDDAVQTISTQSNTGVLGTNDTTKIYAKVGITVTSDARDKTNIEPLAYGLDVVKSVAPVSFQFMDRETGHIKEGVRLGWLAQDFLKQNPSTPIIDQRDPENLKLNESMTVPILWRAVQELSARLEALEGRRPLPFMT